MAAGYDVGVRMPDVHRPQPVRHVVEVPLARIVHQVGARIGVRAMLHVRFTPARGAPQRRKLPWRCVVHEILRWIRERD